MNIRYRVELSEAERSELGCGRGAVAPDIKPVITEQAICGVAVTCHVARPIISRSLQPFPCFRLAM